MRTIKSKPSFSFQWHFRDCHSSHSKSRAIDKLEHHFHMQSIHPVIVSVISVYWMTRLIATIDVWLIWMFLRTFKIAYVFAQFSSFEWWWWYRWWIDDWMDKICMLRFMCNRCLLLFLRSISFQIECISFIFYIYRSAQTCLSASACCVDIKFRFQNKASCAAAFVCISNMLFFKTFVDVDVGVCLHCAHSHSMIRCVLN